MISEPLPCFFDVFWLLKLLPLCKDLATGCADPVIRLYEPCEHRLRGFARPLEHQSALAEAGAGAHATQRAV